MQYLTEEALDLNRVMRVVGNTIYERGRLYFLQRRVEVDYVEPDFASCTVTGKGDTYRVTIEADQRELYFDCTCPYAYDGRICKHSVAAVMAVREYLRTYKPPRWQTQLAQAIQNAQNPDDKRPSPYLLFLSLQDKLYYNFNSWSVVPYLLPFSRLPVETRAALHSGQSVQKALKNLPDVSSQLTQPYHSLQIGACVNASPQLLTLANLLIGQSQNTQQLVSLGSVLSLLSGMDAPLFLGKDKNPLAKPLDIARERGRFTLDLLRRPDGVRLSASLVAGDQRFTDLGSTGTIVSTAPFWIMVDHSLVEIDGDGASPLFAMFLNAPQLFVPAEDENEFLESYYLQLAQMVDLGGDAVEWQTVDCPPVKRLYLSENNKELQAELRFGYGDHEVIYESRLPTQTLRRDSASWTLTNVLRKPELEEAAFDELTAHDFGLKKAQPPENPGTFLLRARVQPVDFLMKCVPQLTQQGYEIYGEESLSSVRVNRTRPTISLNVSSGIDWFDVRAAVNFGDIEVSLKEIRRAMQRRERYVKLADGTLGEIPPDWLERYQHLFALGKERGDLLRLENHHLTMIDQLLADADQAQADQEFEKRASRMRNFAGITPQELPKSFVGDLRPYQKAGYDWLHFLHEFHFGGCLADDMGLGKTVQVLVFLLSLHERGETHHADLIVLPRSLLINWQRETARFTPSLRILEYHGNMRGKDVSVFDEYDLVVTTYGVMMRDINLLNKYPFHYVVLDESQAIKNPIAQTSKAARLLRSDHRLVMTGTPVENSTFELWSQFAFLNPGLLGSLEYFKREFGTPIEKKSDEKKAQFLRQMVFPFILRRTKAQVAPELPPRTERILYSDMEPAQRKLYNRTRDYFRGLLMGMLESGGIDNTRMKVLEGLLRLRQICNHPAIVEREFRGESAKFELLLDTLETLSAEGHKALVFSQFVEMLKMVRKELDIRKLPYVYLDGRTNNRQERVDTFQNDASIPFFLISLKAGGVGLNLTAADYVIHIDPWWNPAVEMQATDRTHRIGQDKPVFVYKLIVRDSVEEKILQLQEKKRGLVDQLISTEGSFLKTLTTDDVKVLFS
jgi:non-specific serine/threonine protein kinase